MPIFHVKCKNLSKFYIFNPSSILSRCGIKKPMGLLVYEFDLDTIKKPMDITQPILNVKLRKARKLINQMHSGCRIK